MEKEDVINSLKKILFLINNRKNEHKKNIEYKREIIELNKKYNKNVDSEIDLLKECIVRENEDKCILEAIEDILDSNDIDVTI